MNKLGFYTVNFGQPGVVQALQEVKPPVLLTHVNDIGALQNIRRQWSPKTFVIGRFVFPFTAPGASAMFNQGADDILTHEDPEAFGQALAQYIIEFNFGAAKQRINNRLLIDAWMSLNEALPGPNSTNWQHSAAREQIVKQAAAYDTLQAAFLKKLQQEGLEAVAFNFAAGNWITGVDYQTYFPKTLQAYTYLGFHEYGWPHMDASQPDTKSSCGIYRQVMTPIRQKYGSQHKVIITEAGLTRAYTDATAGDVGWLSPPPLSEDSYKASLKWYNQHLVADDYVLGACLYQVGTGAGWETFRHTGQDDSGQPLTLMATLKSFAQKKQTQLTPPPTELPAQATDSPAPTPALLLARLDENRLDVVVEGKKVGYINFTPTQSSSPLTEATSAKTGDKSPPPSSPLPTKAATQSAAPATPQPAKSSPPKEAVEKSGFVQVQGEQFILQHQPLKFIGVNIRGLVYYGHNPSGYFPPDADLKDRQLQLDQAHQMGARVVRVFLANKAASPNQVADYLGQLLTEIKQGFPSLYLLPALTNFYNDVPFYVQGDDKFYGQSPDPNFHQSILTRTFFSSGYHENYLPFVQKIVTTFKDEPHIFAWEIGNELKVDNDPATFVDFNLAVAKFIRNLDPYHLVTTGMISTREAYMAGQTALQHKLYGSPDIDFITIHAYNGNKVPPSGAVEDDSPLAHQLKMPFIIEEAGFDCTYFKGDRSPLVQADLDHWFGQGASGYMPWGFMAGPDNGDGDNVVGMEQKMEDWNQLFAVYQQQAKRLGSFV